MIKENMRIKKVETLGKQYGLNTMMTPTNLQDGEFQNLQNTFQYNFGALEKRKGTRYLRVDSDFNFYETDTPDPNMPKGLKSCLSFFVDEAKQEAYGVFDTEFIGQTGDCTLANVSLSGAGGGSCNIDLAGLFVDSDNHYLWLFYLTASSLVYAHKVDLGVNIPVNSNRTIKYDITGVVPSNVQSLKVYVGDRDSPWVEIDTQAGPIVNRSVIPAGIWTGYKSILGNFTYCQRTPYSYPLEEGFGGLAPYTWGAPGMDLPLIGFKAKLQYRGDVATKQFVVTIDDPGEKAKYEKYKNYLSYLGTRVGTIGTQEHPMYAHISYENKTAPAGWGTTLGQDAKVVYYGFSYSSNGALAAGEITKYADETPIVFAGAAASPLVDIYFSVEIGYIIETNVSGDSYIQRQKIKAANPTEELYYDRKGLHEARRAIYYIKKGMTSWARLPLHNYSQQFNQTVVNSSAMSTMSRIQPVYFSYMNLTGKQNWTSPNIFFKKDLNQDQDLFSFTKVGNKVYLTTNQKVGARNIGYKNTYTSFVTDDSTNKDKSSFTNGLTFLMGTSVGTYATGSSNSVFLVSENTPVYDSGETNIYNYRKDLATVTQGFGAINCYGHRSSSLAPFDESICYLGRTDNINNFTLSLKSGMVYCGNISGVLKDAPDYKNIMGPPPATFATSFDGRIVSSGNSARSNDLYHSEDISGPESLIKTWSAIYQTNSGIFSDRNNGGAITGLFSLARNPFSASQTNALLIFKSNATFMITGGWTDLSPTGLDTDYSFSVLTDIGGAISHTAIASIKTGCVFVGENDVYYYDIAQSAITPLGYKVKNLFSTIKDKKFYVDATNYGINRSGCLYAYSHNNIARINFGVNCVKDPLDAESTDYYITRELWLDGRDGSGFPWHGPMLRRFNKNILIDSVFLSPTSLSPISGYQNFNGRIYTSNALTDFRTGAVVGFAGKDMIVLECDTYQDIGNTIESSITSPDYTFGGGSSLKAFNAINLNMEASGSGKIFAMVETGEGQYDGGNMDYQAAAAPSFDISLWDNASWADRFYGFKKIILSRKPMGRVGRLTLAHRENSNFIINNMELVYRFKNRSYL
jgi:hypothetical protein